MNRTEKINAIYEKIARKDLSFGCKTFHKVGDKKGFECKIITPTINRQDGIFYGVVLNNENSVTWLKEEEIGIIGHTVMIGDVIDFVMKNENFDDEEKHYVNTFFFYNWQEKRKPIEEQPDECVDFVYNLINK